MRRCVAATLLYAAAVHASGIALDVVEWGPANGQRLLITVSPEDEHGNDLPAQKLLLDSGSSTLAFCDNTLSTRLSPATFKNKDFLGLTSTDGPGYSCNIYGGTGPHGRIGYWGRFYQGGLHIPNSDVVMKDAYFSVMQQQVGMPCDNSIGVQGIFGIGFHQLNGRSSEAPTSWPSSGVGSCPGDSGTLVPPLMEFLTWKNWAALARQAAKNLWNGHWRSLHAPKQIGIYWSGKEGAGEGQLYLDGDATNNPHYNANAAAKIGKASLSPDGFYEIGVLSVATDCKGKQTSHTVDCSDAGQCIMDTGNPSLVVPQAVFDELSKGKQGTLTVTLAGPQYYLSQIVGLPLEQGQAEVKLEFDVEVLLRKRWISASREGDFVLGLPLRAFYYTVMDISDSTVSFSPMPAHHR